MFARRIATFTATALAVVGLALATAGDASALHSPNDAFLAEIGSEGVVFDSSATAVTNARHACEALAGGESPVTLSSEISDAADLTARQAATFVASAMKNYCPR